MSERRYFVWIDDTNNLNFDDFYDNYLNKKEDGYDTYEELFGQSYDNLRSETKKEFNKALEDGSYFSDSYFSNRTFTCALAEYIGHYIEKDYNTRITHRDIERRKESTT